MTRPLRMQAVQARMRFTVLPTLARTRCRLMFQRRRVMLWAWETLLPVSGFLPQMSHF